MTPLKTISEKLTAWRRYREAVRELSQLSDRELEDIGIRRGDIEYIVRRTVAGQVCGLISAIPDPAETRRASGASASRAGLAAPYLTPEQSALTRPRAL